MGDVPRRARRPVDDRRGVLGARLAGDAGRRRRTCGAAAAYIVARAGASSATRVFTRIWMALFGLWSWDDLPALPPEVILLPRSPSGPAQHLRLRLLGAPDRRAAHRRRLVPPGRGRLRFALDELRTGASRTEAEPRPAGSLGRPLPAARPRAAPLRAPPDRVRCGAWRLARAERWIVAAPGGRRLLGRDPAAVGVLDDRPAPARLPARPPGDARAAFAGLDALQRSRGRRPRRLEACQSPVWDTALAVVALRRRRRRPADDPPGAAPAGWLLDEEVRSRGDWAVRRPRPRRRAAGRSSSTTTTTPTSTTPPRSCSRCDRVRPPSIPARRAGRRRPRASRWADGMQCARRRLGGLRRRQRPASCRRPAVLRLRRGHRPAERRRHRPRRRDARPTCVADGRGDAVDRARSTWLAGCRPSRSATARGSAAGAPTTSTAPARVVPALVAAGVSTADDPRVRRPVSGSQRHQNADGGWGEDLRSYAIPAWKGRGASTASQTAWALLALLALGDRGAGDAPRASPGWSRPSGPTAPGTSRSSPAPGSPRDFYINYHLYRLVFPVMALGRYVALQDESS